MPLRGRKPLQPMSQMGTNFKNLAVQHILSQHLELKLNHIYNEDGDKMSVDSLMKQKPEVWKPSVSNEIGRLAQGV